MYTYTAGFQPSNWSVVSTLIPHPYPNQSDIASLYDDVIILFFIIIVFINYVLTKLYVVFFVFSVLVLVLFSNEYPPLNMLN